MSIPISQFIPPPPSPGNHKFAFYIRASLAFFACRHNTPISASIFT